MRWTRCRHANVDFKQSTCLFLDLNQAVLDQGRQSTGEEEIAHPVMCVASAHRKTHDPTGNGPIRSSHPIFAAVAKRAKQTLWARIQKAASSALQTLVLAAAKVCKEPRADLLTVRFPPVVESVSCLIDVMLLWGY